MNKICQVRQDIAIGSLFSLYITEEYLHNSFIIIPNFYEHDLGNINLTTLCGFTDQKRREIVYSDKSNTKLKEKIPLGIVEKHNKHDNSVPDSWRTVTRYKMVSKRIGNIDIPTYIYIDILVAI